MILDSPLPEVILFPLPPSRRICGAAFGWRAEHGGGQRRPEGIFQNVSAILCVLSALCGFYI